MDTLRDPRLAPPAPEDFTTHDFGQTITSDILAVWVRGNDLIAWKLVDGHVTGPLGASDLDEDTAAAVRDQTIRAARFHMVVDGALHEDLPTVATDPRKATIRGLTATGARRRPTKSRARSAAGTLIEAWFYPA